MNIMNTVNGSSLFLSLCLCGLYLRYYKAGGQIVVCKQKDEYSQTNAGSHTVLCINTRLRILSNAAECTRAKRFFPCLHCNAQTRSLLPL